MTSVPRTIIETVMETTYQPQTINCERQVTVCKQVPEVITKQIPVTTCTMVSEVVTKQVPVTTCRMVAETVMTQVPGNGLRSRSDRMRQASAGHDLLDGLRKS